MEKDKKTLHAPFQADFEPQSYSTLVTTTDVTVLKESLVKSQIVPDQVYVENLRKGLRSEECYVNCPYCLNQCGTKTLSTCSTPNILCFVLSTPVLWSLFQFFRSKDLNCYDTEHFCKKCGQELGLYNSC